MPSLSIADAKVGIILNDANIILKKNRHSSHFYLSYFNVASYTYLIIFGINFSTELTNHRIKHEKDTPFNCQPFVYSL